jgi:hypothetical protein
MTLARMTFSITKASTTTLRIADFMGTLSIIDIQHKGHASLCRVSHFYIVMLNMVTLSVVMLDVVMMSMVTLSVVMLDVVMLSMVTLSVYAGRRYAE